MLAPMTPENGGKVELKLGQTSAGSAEYRAHLQTPGGSFYCSAQVGEAAGREQVAFGEWGPEAPPEWLTADARAALKAALRTSQSEGRWPRRITRWRPAPSSSE